jgi:hypothetical protein
MVRVSPWTAAPPSALPGGVPLFTLNSCGPQLKILCLIQGTLSLRVYYWLGPSVQAQEGGWGWPGCHRHNRPTCGIPSCVVTCSPLWHIGESGCISLREGHWSSRDCESQPLLVGAVYWKWQLACTLLRLSSCFCRLLFQAQYMLYI